MLMWAANIFADISESNLHIVVPITSTQSEQMHLLFGQPLKSREGKELDESRWSGISPKHH